MRRSTLPFVCVSTQEGEVVVAGPRASEGRRGKRKIRWPVSRVLSFIAEGVTIPLGCVSPHTSRDLPGRLSGNGLRAVPIWSCSRWGLPCRRCCQQRGALLPHHFNLASPKRRSAVSFLWRCPWGRPRRSLSGTVSPWSPDFPPAFAEASAGKPAKDRRRRAVIRPSDAPAV